MDHNNRRASRWRHLVAALFTSLFMLGQFAMGGGNSLVSGTYAVLQEENLGSQERILIRIHLVNHGPSNLSIQRITLWDVSHADRHGTRVCAVALQGHGAADTTEEFMIQHADYNLWKRGMRPRLVLQLAGPHNGRSKTMVQLDRLSDQEVK